MNLLVRYIKTLFKKKSISKEVWNNKPLDIYTDTTEYKSNPVACKIVRFFGMCAKCDTRPPCQVCRSVIDIIEKDLPTKETKDNIEI